MGKQVETSEIYEALKCLGHSQLWLRDNGKYNRHIITWDNMVAASYNPYLKSWNFRKNACRINDNLSGKTPSGKGLTELLDVGHAAQQSFGIDDW
ncbi:TPA: hypothetical protein ACXRZA_005159 [Klebsiella pneumoniae]